MFSVLMYSSTPGLYKGKPLEGEMLPLLVRLQSDSIHSRVNYQPRFDVIEHD